MENKRNYIKDLCKNWHFIVALLLTSLAITFISASYDYGILRTIFNNTHILKITAVLFIFFALSLIIYMCVNLKNKNLTTADSLYIAFVFIGVGFFIYTACVLKSFNLVRLTISITLLTLGFFFTTIRIHLYYTNSCAKTFSPKNKISKYYAGIFAKFPFISMLILSGVCILLSYFLTETQIIAVIKQPKTFIVCLVCILPTFVYAITKLTSPYVTVFDALGFACIFSFPLILVKLMYLTYSPLKISVWAIAFAIFMIFLFFRFKFFDANAKIKEKEKQGYFAKLFGKYDLGLILSVGGLIALFSSLLIDSDLLHPIYMEGSINIYAHLLPNLILTVFALLTLAFFAAIILFGCKTKGISLVDLFLQFCLSFIIFSFIALISHPSPIMIMLLISFSLYSILMLIVRITSYK